MKSASIFSTLAVTAVTILSSVPAQADNMASIAITPATGVVTLAPRWSIGPGLAGFHYMAQDLSLGGGPSQFYSIKNTTIPSGGDITAFTHYIAASGAAVSHTDIGSKLTPDSYSALTSADPDVGYGPVNLYFIHHKGTTDYFTDIVPSSGTASAVTDLKPMSGPGGPSTVTGVSGYFGLTFAAANLGYGLNLFYYLRSDPVTGSTKFGTLEPALLGTSVDKFDLGSGGHNALAFTGTDVGYGPDKMYYLRLDPLTGFTVFGTLNPVTGRVADIANLGSVYSTLTFAPGDVGFGTGQFYTTGSVNTTWQSVSFAAIADRAFNAGSFTVSPSASSGLPITLTVVTGSAMISAPVAGVFTVTPLAPGLITLQATQAGQAGVSEFNMLRQAFVAWGGTPDFNSDSNADLFWSNSVTGDRAMWLMNGTTINTNAFVGTVPTAWVVSGTGDFNGDGKADILWSNTVTGDRAMWLMNGTTISANAFLGTVPVAWVVSGTGDYNGDGNADILWTNTTTGERAMWLMNGSTVTTGASFGVVSTAWVVSGTGDFNADGKADILWSNTTTGQRSIWLMNGTTISANAPLDTVPVTWVVSGTGDFNGDGKADILWSNTITGDRAMWLMNGTTIGTNAYVGSVPVAWVVSNTRDFNGDGHADIFWTNNTTGERAMWLMNGTTMSAGASLGVVPVAWSPSN